MARVRASEKRNGRAYVKHPRKPLPGLDELELDLSALDLMAVQSGPEQQFWAFIAYENWAPACARSLHGGVKEPKRPWE